MSTTRTVFVKSVVIAFFAILFFASAAQADVYVNGYYRSNGTYVNGYYRSSPDSNPYNNYSYPGNYNPYTGVTAGGNSSTYLQNYYNNSTGGSGYTSPTYNIPTYTPSYYGGSTGGSSFKNGLYGTAEQGCWDLNDPDFSTKLKQNSYNIPCLINTTPTPRPTPRLTPYPTPAPLRLFTPTPTPKSPATRCVEQYGLQSRYDVTDGLCYYCKIGYTMIGDKCHANSTPTPTPAPTQIRLYGTATPRPLVLPLPSATPTKKFLDDYICDTGFARSLDGKRCVALPLNSHAASNGRDVWLCDAGYVEIGDACLSVLAPSASPELHPSSEGGWFSRFLRKLF